MARGLTASVISYLNGRQNGTFTIDDLKKQFPDWDHHQIMQVVANLLNPKYTPECPVKGVRKIQTGVWSLDEVKEPAKPTLAFDQITVTIIKEVDGEMVVVDDNTNIYRMVRVS